MEHIFLGNSRHFLHLTADYLEQRYYQHGHFNLKNVMLVLQEQRAINRLEELLAEKAEQIDPAWYPPEFLTIGVLPERLYELKRPPADDITQCFAWIVALDRLDDEHPDLLRRLIPSPPSRNDIAARISLGKMLTKLHTELAADTLNFEHADVICRELKIESETQRWQALGTLQKQYHLILDSLADGGLWDKQSARLFALERPDEFDIKRTQFEQLGTEILLVGVVDMNAAHRQMLRYFPDFVTPLVFAPDDWANRFDDLGCLKPDVWQNIPIGLQDEQIHVVGSASEQAEEVLRCLSKLQGRYAPAEIVVGVPDKQIVPFIERHFEEAGVAVRIVAGRSIRQTAVYRFLETLLPFLESPTFANVAALIRHPNVETYLMRHANPTDANQTRANQTRANQTHGGEAAMSAETPKTTSLITALDQHYSQFLPINWTAASGERSSLSGLSLAFLFDDLSQILDTLFPDEDHGEAMQKVLDTLHQIRNVPADLLPELSHLDTLRLVLTQLGNASIPMPSDPDAVELIGWLDIAMDDADIVIVTGMNDGIVPAFQTSDMFLPDSMRRNLAIEDNCRRYARDAYALSCILAARQYDVNRVHFVSGRQSVEGDPMLPSRLFFSAEDSVIAHRILRFFGDPKEIAPRIQFRPISKPDVVFEPPAVPEGAGQSIRQMNVTDFKKYKECPYRYYLSCCQTPKLQTLHDSDTELHARAFGSLIHDVLELFGKTAGIRESTSAGRINDFLVQTVRTFAQKKYGDHPRPVVAIQTERAIKRLEAFANWQANWAREYEIAATELQFNDERFSLDVDGDTMQIRGRIDRIDRHRKTNELIIWDYKTGRKTIPGEHIKNGEWVDFQLPLYYHLLSQHAEFGHYLRQFQSPSAWQLGYILLPPDVSKTGKSLAEWDRAMVLSAIDEARCIVRSIWKSKFDKASIPPKYSDEFSVICHDF